MAQDFDVTFKVLFRRSHGVLSRLLFGDVVEWPNVEQPKVRNLRPDLLARCSDGSLRHVEFQVTNDDSIPFRMLEYYVGGYRDFGRHIQQIVLYAGREPMRMPAFFETVSFRHEFAILNLREMDGTPLLASDDWADNVFALLTRSDPHEVLRVVFDKLRQLSGAEQATAASTFAIIGGIINMEDEITRRFRTGMIDIMENKIIGPAIRQGLEQGHREGMVRILRNLLEKRFGPLPPWAAAKLLSASPETLDFWSLRIDESAQLEQILS